MKALVVKGLSKQFGNFKAVSELDLSIKENTIFGFLGPNGAGKTTTLRMIVGLSKPTSGEISILGNKVVFGQIETNRLFGYLPEAPAFYGWMSGKEYLGFVGKLLDLSESKRNKETERLLELVNLQDAGKKKIAAYSNGMKQRLGIAQALIGNPKLLILDEPVSALDPIGRREVLQIIEKLKKEKTILMSTHILGDVDRVCDEVAIISNGKLIVQAPLGDLKKKYATPILEVEFGSSPEGIVDKIEKEKWAKKVEKSGNLIRVWLTGEGLNENLPLEFLLKSKIVILKYGLSLPAVEDLFIELVEKKS